MSQTFEPPARTGLVYGTAPDGSRTVTLPDELRSYIQQFVHDGGTRTPAEIESIAQDGHDALMQALAPLSEAQAAYKPGENDWSILDLMAHVVSTKQVMVVLSTNLAAGNLPPGFGPQFEEQAEQDGFAVTRFSTLADARAAADAAHADLIAFVRGIDASTNTDVTFKHFLFGAFNAREWPIFQRVHDIDHTPQIGQIMSTPGFPAR